MSEGFEEAIIKRLDNLDNRMSEIKSILEYEIKMKFLILDKSNELIYKINKQNEEELKFIANILSKSSIQIAHLYETVKNQSNN